MTITVPISSKTIHLTRGNFDNAYLCTFANLNGPLSFLFLPISFIGLLTVLHQLSFLLNGVGLSFQEGRTFACRSVK